MWRGTFIASSVFMRNMFAPRFSLAVFYIVIPVQSVAAQSAATAPDTVAGAPLFTGRDIVRAVGFAGLTVAMFPADRSIARRLTNERSKANKFLNNASKGVELIADPGSIVIGSSLYAIGRITNHPDIEDLGWHGTEAVIFGSSITWILKGVAGRARPFATADTTAHDFKFGGGFGDADRQSFPSGHTTAAFAAASAVTSEAERMWPHHFWLVAPVMYGGASLVGLSRMYHDKHWASDVVLGAAVGTFSGLKIVRYSHTHPSNRLDRAILGLQIVPLPSGAGAGVALSFQAP
jgi:membrane-associated phospholipid phosphatase